MFVVVVITPLPYMVHGVISDYVSNKFRGDELVRVYVLCTRSINVENVTNAVYEALRGQCDLLLTIGERCTSITREILKKEKLSIFQLSAGIDPSYARYIEAEVTDSLFALISYDYSDSAAQGVPFYAACAPHVRTAFAVVDKAVLGWGRDYGKDLAEAFRLKNIKFETHYAQTTDSFQELFVSMQDQYDAVLLPEGWLSLNFHKLCSHMANKLRKPFFIGSLNEVASGDAGVGYGGDYTEMGRIAGDWIELIAKEGYDAAAHLTVQKAPVDRRCAVNLKAAELQGLDPDHVAKVCADFDGIVYGRAQ